MQSPVCQLLVLFYSILCCSESRAASETVFINHCNDQEIQVTLAEEPDVSQATPNSKVRAISLLEKNKRRKEHTPVMTYYHHKVKGPGGFVHPLLSACSK